MCQAINDGGKRCPIHRTSVSNFLSILNQAGRGNFYAEGAFTDNRKIALQNDLSEINPPQTADALWQEIFNKKGDRLDRTNSLTRNYLDQYIDIEFTEEMDAATFVALKATAKQCFDATLFKNMKDEIYWTTGCFSDIAANVQAELANDILSEERFKPENEDLEASELYNKVFSKLTMIARSIPENAIFTENGSLHAAHTHLSYYDPKTERVTVAFVESGCSKSISINKYSASDQKRIIEYIRTFDYTSTDYYNDFDNFMRILSHNLEDRQGALRCEYCGRFKPTDISQEDNPRALKFHVCEATDELNRELRSFAMENDLNSYEEYKIAKFLNSKDSSLLSFLSDEHKENPLFKIDADDYKVINGVRLSLQKDMDNIKNMLTIQPQIFDDGIPLKANTNIVIITPDADLPDDLKDNLFVNKIKNSLKPEQHYLLQEKFGHYNEGIIISHETKTFEINSGERLLVKDYSKIDLPYYTQEDLLTSDNLANDKSYFHPENLNSLIPNIDKEIVLPMNYYETTAFNVRKVDLPYIAYIHEDNHEVTGNFISKFDEDKNLLIIDREKSLRALKCDCDNYKRLYRCEHIDISLKYLSNETLMNANTIFQEKLAGAIFNDNFVNQYLNKNYDIEKDAINLDRDNNLLTTNSPLLNNSLRNPYEFDVVYNNNFNTYKNNILNDYFAQDFDFKDKNKIGSLINDINTLSMISYSSMHDVEQNTDDISNKRSRLKNLLLYKEGLEYSEPATIQFRDKNFYLGDSSNSSPQKFKTTGELMFRNEKNEKGLTVLNAYDVRELKCDCPDYVEKYDCEHVRAFKNFYIASQELTSESEQGKELYRRLSHSLRYNARQGILLHESVADEYIKEKERVYKMLNSLPKISNNKNTVERAYDDPTNDSIVNYRNVEKDITSIKNYLNNDDQLWTDYNQVTNNKRRKDDYLPFNPTGTVTNSVFAPETGLKFGLEIEVVENYDELSLDEFSAMVNMHNVDISEDEMEAAHSDYENEIKYLDSSERMEKVINAMNALNYTNQNEVQSYHSSKDTAERMQKWTIEEDGSVDFELVTPPMSDSPESWNQINNVTYLLKRYGFTISPNCGGHINVSTGGSVTNKELVNTAQLVNDNIAMFQRLGQDVKAGRHRGSEYCEPIIEPTIFDTDDEMLDHYVEAVHYPALKVHQKNRLEFRIFDGSLEPSTLQHRMSLVAGSMVAGVQGTKVDIAQENESIQYKKKEYEHIRHGDYDQLENLRGRERRILDGASKHTKETLVEESSIFKSFASRIAQNNEDAKRLTQLYSATFWSADY